MSWRKVFSQLDDISDRDIEAFAHQNAWDPVSGDDKFTVEIFQNYKGTNKWRVLDLLFPCLNPALLLESIFIQIIPLLLQSKNEELVHIDIVTRIVVKALKYQNQSSSLSEEISEKERIFLKRLKQSAKQFLNAFIEESRTRWIKLDNIAAGKELFTEHIALDPSRVPRLEFVLFSFGMGKPLLFYELLNEMAVDSTTRLHSLMLLKSFLILENAPTYYLIDSELYKTVITLALIDTDASIFLTAITILTILLPIVATKAVAHLDQLVDILLSGIDWELSYPTLLAQHSPKRDTGSSTPTIDDILSWHSVNAVTNCINQYFTVLYGMFPCNVLEALGHFLKSNTPKNLPKSRGGILKATDAFENERADVIQTLNLQSVRFKRVQELMSSRRCHLNIITSTTKAEREQPWFLNKEPSEVMITCFSLEAQETHDQFSPISGSVSSSLEDIAQHILQINRILYGPTFKTHLPKSNQDTAEKQKVQDRVILLKIYYIILMNEGFFKECMRQYHIFHIRQLRKHQIMSEIDKSDLANKDAKLATTESELSTSKAMNAQLHSDVKNLESRLKISEMSYSQRFNNISDQLKEKTKLLIKAQSDIKTCQEQSTLLDTELGKYKSKVASLELEISMANSEIIRLTQSDNENNELRKQLESLQVVPKEPVLNDQIPVEAELELTIQALRQQISQYQSEKKSLQEQLDQAVMKNTTLAREKDLNEQKALSFENVIRRYDQELKVASDKCEMYRQRISDLETKSLS